MRGLESSRNKTVENTRDTRSEWDSLSDNYESYENDTRTMQEIGAKVLSMEGIDDDILNALRSVMEGSSDLDQMRGQESKENILGDDEPQSKSEGPRTAEESIRMFEDAINNSSDDEQKNETPISGLF